MSAGPAPVMADLTDPRLVILDRDGVINEDSADFIKSPDEFIPIPGALEAIAALNSAGFTVVIATNQSGLARGLFDDEDLDDIHAKLDVLLAEHGGSIDAVFLCPHGPDDGCDCRKPAPGLLRQIAAHYGVDLSGVPAVGDSIRDLQAASTAGAMPVLVRTGNGTASERDPAAEGMPTHDDLAAFVRAYIGVAS
jgi:D-glycero-D-manno-heptose 1,7-bisphosphate phosphatase